jgi:hypothetical protein
MTTLTKLICAVSAAGFVAVATMPAQALTMQECSAKYKEAKSAGTLNGQKWNDFRKAQCEGGTTAAAPAAAPASKMAPAAKMEKPRTAASLECSKEADAKGLHGKERKKFRSECKAKAAKSAKTN